METSKRNMGAEGKVVGVAGTVDLGRQEDFFEIKACRVWPLGRKI